jgi:hypothetical protein
MSPVDLALLEQSRRDHPIFHAAMAEVRAQLAAEYKEMRRRHDMQWLGLLLAEAARAGCVLVIKPNSV